MVFPRFGGHEHRTAIGTVQAALAWEEQDMVAEVAWTIGVSHQRRGYATEAVEAMITWLGRHDVNLVAAHIRRVRKVGGTPTLVPGQRFRHLWRVSVASGRGCRSARGEIRSLGDAAG
jgi:hypothetical protein